MKKSLLYVFIGIILIYLYLINSKKSSLTQWDIDNTKEIYQNDDALINSKILTQKNLAYFISEFKAKNKNEDEFYVKIRITENGEAEHMWLDLVKLDGKKSIGILDNVPLKFKKLKYLDTVIFDINKAEDIMLFKNDSLILGGFLLSESLKK